MEGNILNTMHKVSLESTMVHGSTIREIAKLCTVYEYEQAVQNFIQWIILRNRLVSGIEDLEFRCISRFIICISVKTVTEVLFQ